MLFHLKGYHATGLSQILKESGAPKGSLYYHFPNGKEQLALEAINLSVQTISTMIKENLASYEDPVKAFQHHSSFWYRYYFTVNDECVIAYFSDL